ncbi:NACHT domain-containing protein [Agarivorans sp. Z349TD_8]|uniref:NACHT domain-containing protein n=1 Tax=Agarivorans sp. Z349TD_8 TaxID=3421434 RepID=UPI003D7D4622
MTKEKGKVSPDSLVKAVLYARKITPTAKHVEEAREKLEKVPLVLDGLDEVITHVPDIIDGIKSFKLANPCSQVIVSSRDNYDYVKDMGFTSICLMPFTETQLFEFVTNVCTSKNVANKVVNLIKSNDLFEVLSNPLLATIACALAEHGVRVPSKESKLYEKRFLLLTGEYDHYKNIIRQKNLKENLQGVAILLAWKMHEKGLRQVEFDEALSWLLKDRSIGLEPHAVQSCLSELICPCNILIQINSGNILTFGHFRFQESLVAMRLSRTQANDFETLLELPFWKGAFGLYADSNDIHPIFHYLSGVDRYNCDYENTLKEMISRADIGRVEKEGLLDLLDMWAKEPIL